MYNEFLWQKQTVPIFNFLHGFWDTLVCVLSFVRGELFALDFVHTFVALDIEKLTY